MVDDIPWQRSTKSILKQRRASPLLRKLESPMMKEIPKEGGGRRGII